MGMSIRAYARHRGVSPSAVHKAIKTGRITPEEDSTLEPEKADQQWAQNTNPIRGKNQHKESTDNISDPNHGSYIKAKAANEVLKAQHIHLKLRKEKGELIDKAQALSHIFAFARAYRNAWLNWPARISAQLASEFKIDPHQLQAKLDDYIREQLNEIADIKPQLD